MVLDGWGLAKDPTVSAIDRAHTPFIDSLYTTYPNTQLMTSGLHVGLPDGQMGNSEVGHMNLGAGRVVYQDLVRVNRSIESGELADNVALRNAFQYALDNKKAVHLMGLLSPGGVHAHQNHLVALCKLAAQFGLSDVFIHAFTDGRDCDPEGGADHVHTVQQQLDGTPARFASLVGRYYAMDRDQRWERIQKAYDLLIHGKGTPCDDPVTAIRNSYASGTTDEFIEPHVVTDDAGKPLATVAEGDVVICFNFRTDRGRQLTMALTQNDYPDHGMQKLDLYYVTMTRYDDKFTNVHVLFEKENLTQTLGEVVASSGKKQMRIAETEKYPHVTFFFSGGREQLFEGEERRMVQSPKVATYDLQPEMSAEGVKEALVDALKSEEPDFVCVNFANADMVGHTGVMEAAIKACETVDMCVKESVEVGLEHGYTFIILADHGNSDCMINPDGSPNTAHTTNPVPCFLINGKAATTLNKGKLGDVAPTICHLMGLTIPKEMSGDSLITAEYVI